MVFGLYGVDTQTKERTLRPIGERETIGIEHARLAAELFQNASGFLICQAGIAPLP